MNPTHNESRYFKTLLLILFLIGFVSSATAQGRMKEINGNEVEKYVATNSVNKPLLMFLSSTDGSCRPCIFGNGGMGEALDSLKENYNVVAVYFNPYRDIYKNNKNLVEKYKITGLPTTVIFHKGKLIMSQAGEIPNKAKQFKKVWEKHFKSK